MELDLLVEADSVVTLDGTAPRARRIGIWRDRIVGVDDQVDGLSARRRLTLRGCTVVPGLRDAHCHTTSVGIVDRHLDLGDCADPQEALRRLEVHSAGLGADEPAVGFGWGFALDGSAPTHEQLARASSDRAVMLVHRSGHLCLVSTRVLRPLSGLLSDDEAQFVDRDGAGDPTGILHESAMDAAKELLGSGSSDHLVDALDAATRHYLSLGLTGYTEAGIGCAGLDHSPVEVGVYQRAREEKRLHTRASLMVYSERLHALDPPTGSAERFGLDLGLRTGLGDPWLRIGAMKLWADGSGGSDGIAALVADPRTLTRRIVEAHRSGWQVAVHAMGDVAVDLFLDALESLGSPAEVRSRRHRIEHAGLVRSDQVARMAALGVVAVIQPLFIDEFGDQLAQSMGDRHDTESIRAQSFLAAGVPVAASSDAPVADPSPLAGIASLALRRTSSGRPFGAHERLTPEEALRTYTYAAAYADHLEGQLGSITTGKLADLTVLDSDPTAGPAEEIADIGVVATIIGGRLVHSRDLDLDLEKGTSPRD